MWALINTIAHNVGVDVCLSLCDGMQVLQTTHFFLDLSRMGRMSWNLSLQTTILGFMEYHKVMLDSDNLMSKIEFPRHIFKGPSHRKPIKR